MVDYTSLSIEQPVGDRFREECPDGLNQSEFLTELLDAYDGSNEESVPVGVATSEDIDALQDQIAELERQVLNVAGDTVSRMERNLR